MCLIGQADDRGQIIEGERLGRWEGEIRPERILEDGFLEFGIRNSEWGMWNEAKKLGSWEAEKRRSGEAGRLRS